MALNTDGMFYRLWDGSVARNAKQAVGFYGVHLLVTVVVFVVLSLAVEYAMAERPLGEMLRVQFVGGMVFSILYIAGLGLWVMHSKRLWRSLHCWIVLIAGIAVAYMGTLVGLLGPAYLSILRPSGRAESETGGKQS